MITNYDPNIRWATHTVELTFMQWDYSLTVQQTVNGNCKGSSQFESALSFYFEGLPFDGHDRATIILSRPAEDGDGEDTLEVDLVDEEELAVLCVSARIVGHEKKSRK